MNIKKKNTQKIRWTANEAWNWYRIRSWLCGFNFVTSTAVNSTEMWQDETFDLESIDRELGWAEKIGFNSCRVFLQYLIWHDDPNGLIERIDQFLEVADKHKISTIFCLFDDCAFSGKEPYLGRQDDPVPGVHNSAWTSSPGHKKVTDQSVWPQLEEFVTTIVSHYSKDQRILAWDIYNEPGNSGMENKSLPLLGQAFQWARRAKPEQLLTTAVWNRGLQNITEATLELSDIVTFHNYDNLLAVQKQISYLKSYKRPLICTEWMARHRGSLFQTHLPFFKQEKIGCYCWGLVNGKTQTHFPWGSSPGTSESSVWFHDILHQDGNPYQKEEIKIIRKYTRGSVKGSSWKMKIKSLTIL